MARKQGPLASLRPFCGRARLSWRQKPARPSDVGTPSVGDSPAHRCHSSGSASLPHSRSRYGSTWTCHGGCFHNSRQNSGRFWGGGEKKREAVGNGSLRFRGSSSPGPRATCGVAYFRLCGAATSSAWGRALLMKGKRGRCRCCPGLRL